MRSLACLLLLSVAPAFGADAPVAEYRLQVLGQLVIDRDGTVQEYALEQGQAPQVEGLIEESVRAWKFEPIVVDGKPVVAKTRMSLVVQATPRDDDFVLRVDNVWFGEPKQVGKSTAPTYPRAAIKAGLEARVLLTARIDATGKVVDVHPYQTSLSRKGGETRWRNLFEQASLAAARTWTYETDLLDGNPRGMTVQIPVEYMLTSGATRKQMDAQMNRWRGFLPGPITPAPWVDASSVAAADGQAAALDSPFKLRSDVLGKAL